MSYYTGCDFCGEKKIPAFWFIVSLCWFVFEWFVLESVSGFVIAIV